MPGPPSDTAVRKMPNIDIRIRSGAAGDVDPGYQVAATCFQQPAAVESYSETNRRFLWKGQAPRQNQAPMNASSKMKTASLESKGPSSSTTAKKLYEAPVLHDWGTLEELTLARGNSGKNDGGRPPYSRTR